MRKLRMTALLPALLIATGAHASLRGGPTDTLHDNGYGTPKIEYEPSLPEMGLHGRDLAEAYLRNNAQRYGIAEDLGDLRFESARKSLGGVHYSYQQVHEGFVVDKARVIVTLDATESRVTMVFNNAFPFPIKESPSPVLNTELAYDAAWKDLAPRKGLQADPSANLKYRPEGKTTRLVYEVVLNVAAPHGSWEYVIDAKSGELITKRDRNIYRRPRHAAPASGPILDRHEAFNEWYRRRAANEDATASDAVQLNGTALVFDPDPRTTLRKRDLQDDSDAAAFDEAYVERPLLGLTKRGGDVYLEGPWVRITEFDSPETLPSKTKTGRWDFKRGDNAFNDVMTYFHIDQSQRYIQSLGFKNDTGIQFGPIKVDTNGANGDDNSYFSPNDNSLAFGHGCVDDNEDADVILHEYGHSLQWSINHDWDGGDTGAMGEGFGDYWAASYSLSTPNGEAYYPAQVFSWDAHGEGDHCWAGRVLDATHLQYDPQKRYPAHGTIGSNSTDELWSTPLFQALLDARARGIPREEVDRIVLQAHFGLGSGVTMREMANATVNAAKALYPDGPHAAIFLEKFHKHGIIEEPKPRFEIESMDVIDTGGDNVVDPGDKATVTLHLKNVGTEAAPSAAFFVSSTSPYASVTAEDSDLGSVEVGASATVRLQLEVRKDLPCGEKIPLTVTVRHGKGEDALPETIDTGRPNGVDIGEKLKLDIPDNNPEGVVAELESKAEGVVTKAINVDVEIKHTYPRDLEVKLMSPSGKSVSLLKRDSTSKQDVIGNFPATLTPTESLDALIGEPLAGPWRLVLVDAAKRDVGNLESWRLRDVTGYQCTSN